MNGEDDRSMVALEWTLQEVSHIVREYAYLARYPLPIVTKILVQVYEGNVIEFLRWGWKELEEELERYDMLMRTEGDGVGNIRAHQCTRADPSSFFPRIWHAEQLYCPYERVRLH